MLSTWPNVPFLVRFNNFDKTMGFYRSYSSRLFLCALGSAHAVIWTLQPRDEFLNHYCECMHPVIPHTHKVHAETECSKAMAEFARIEEQLSGVERYAMKYLEEANAEFAAAQLRLAEVRIQETNLSLVSLMFEVMAHNIA